MADKGIEQQDRISDHRKVAPIWLAGVWVAYFLSSVTYLVTNMLRG